MKKEKEFINVQQAEDYKAKMEKVKKSLLIPFIVSIPSSLLFSYWVNVGVPDTSGVLGFFLEVLMWIDVLALAFVWIFTIVKGGKTVLSILGKILFLGFIIIPLPFSLFVGLIVLGLGIYAVVLAPWLILIAVWLKTKKEIKFADEYIYYNSVQTSNTQENVE